MLIIEEKFVLIAWRCSQHVESHSEYGVDFGFGPCLESPHLILLSLHLTVTAMGSPFFSKGEPLEFPKYSSSVRT